MKILSTGPDNMDFIHLTKKLDVNLTKLSDGQSEKVRSQYESYNELSNITKAFVLYDNDIAIGCAAYKRHTTDEAEVKRVYISEEYRGRGLSKALLFELEKQVKRDGFKSLILETGKNNQAANKLYKAIQYQEIANFPPYTEMLDSVCLRKEL